MEHMTSYCMALLKILLKAMSRAKRKNKEEEQRGRTKRKNKEEEQRGRTKRKIYC